VQHRRITHLEQKLFSRSLRFLGVLRVSAFKLAPRIWLRFRRTFLFCGNSALPCINPQPPKTNNRPQPLAAFSPSATNPPCLPALSRVVTACHGLSRLVTACHGLSRLVTAPVTAPENAKSPVFTGLVTGCHGLSRVVTAEFTPPRHKTKLANPPEPANLG
jgi:hypothetical protein